MRKVNYQVGMRSGEEKFRNGYLLPLTIKQGDYVRLVLWKDAFGEWLADDFMTGYAIPGRSAWTRRELAEQLRAEERSLAKRIREAQRGLPVLNRLPNAKPGAQDTGETA